MDATSSNTETSQYLPHTIYHKNAAQQDRRNPGDPTHPHTQMLRRRTGEIQETHTAGPRIRKCCAAGPEKSRRPTQQDRGLTTSQHICTNNFNNIFNPRLHAFPATSTLLPTLSWSQHLLPSSSYHRISIASSVCVCILDRCIVTSRNR
jgi:hypothetical protein